jgi:hypothetical protein
VQDKGGGLNAAKRRRLRVVLRVGAAGLCEPTGNNGAPVVRPLRRMPLLERRRCSTKTVSEVCDRSHVRAAPGK